MHLGRVECIGGGIEMANYIIKKNENKKERKE
jgi:hypothetical protein